MTKVVIGLAGGSVHPRRKETHSILPQRQLVKNSFITQKKKQKAKTDPSEGEVHQCSTKSKVVLVISITVALIKARSMYT